MSNLNQKLMKKVMILAGLVIGFSLMTMTVSAQKANTTNTKSNQTQQAAPVKGQFVDSNHDGICDNHQGMMKNGKCANFVDKNNDGKCDNCQAKCGQGNACCKGKGQSTGCGQGMGMKNQHGQGNCPMQNSSKPAKN
jgi:hypothetical protein